MLSSPVKVLWCSNKGKKLYKMWSSKYFFVLVIIEPFATFAHPIRTIFLPLLNQSEQYFYLCSTNQNNISTFAQPIKTIFLPLLNQSKQYFYLCSTNQNTISTFAQPIRTIFSTIAQPIRTIFLPLLNQSEQLDSICFHTEAMKKT